MVDGETEHAHVDLVALDVDGQRWALPLEAVERAIPMVAVSDLPGSPAGVVGAINVHGEPVPVLDLDVRIGRPPRDRGTRGRLLLVRTPHRRVALPVDDVLGVIAVERAAIRPAPEPGAVAGIAAVPGGVLLISDVDAFLSSADERALTAALG